MRTIALAVLLVATGALPSLACPFATQASSDSQQQTAQAQPPAQATTQTQ